uniref:Galectin n=1 Tax=Meloidogyne floridensis TaxID=298350 RepID=A0A915PBE7_9BILA
MLDGTQTRIGKQLNFPFEFPQVKYDDEMLATPEHTINGSTNHINIYIEDEDEHLHKEHGVIYLINEIHIKGIDSNNVVIQGN